MNKVVVTRAEDGYVPIDSTIKGQFALTKGGDLVFRSGDNAVLLKDGDRYVNLEKSALFVRVLPPGTQITITVG